YDDGPEDPHRDPRAVGADGGARDGALPDEDQERGAPADGARARREEPGAARGQSRRHRARARPGDQGVSRSPDAHRVAGRGDGPGAPGDRGIAGSGGRRRRVVAPAEAVQLVDTTDRAAVAALLELDELVDLIIPRGGEELVRWVSRNSRVPVLKHDKGVVHVFVDADADAAMAGTIVVNAKAQRPSVCNALETLLGHRAIAASLLS